MLWIGEGKTVRHPWTNSPEHRCPGACAPRAGETNYSGASPEAALGSPANRPLFRSNGGSRDVASVGIFPRTQALLPKSLARWESEEDEDWAYFHVNM